MYKQWIDEEVNDQRIVFIFTCLLLFCFVLFDFQKHTFQSCSSFSPTRVGKYSSCCTPLTMSQECAKKPIKLIQCNIKRYQNHLVGYWKVSTQLQNYCKISLRIAVFDFSSEVKKFSSTRWLMRVRKTCHWQAASSEPAPSRATRAICMDL